MFSSQRIGNGGENGTESLGDLHRELLRHISIEFHEVLIVNAILACLHLEKTSPSLNSKH